MEVFCPILRPILYRFLAKEKGAQIREKHKLPCSFFPCPSRSSIFPPKIFASDGFYILFGLFSVGKRETGSELKLEIRELFIISFSRKWRPCWEEIQVSKTNDTRLKIYQILCKSKVKISTGVECRMTQRHNFTKPYPCFASVPEIKTNGSASLLMRDSITKTNAFLGAK